MELEQLVPGIIGAFVGVIGWLFVGVYIQRRQFMSQARNAARAVYFEVDVNRVAVTVARDFGSFTPLDRTSFERLPGAGHAAETGRAPTHRLRLHVARRIPAGVLRRR